MMTIPSNLLQNSEPLIDWDAGSQLTLLDLEDLEYGSGFLQIDLGQFFQGAFEHWMLLLHSLNVKVTDIRVETSLAFPANLSRIVSFEVSGEPSVLGMGEAGIEFFKTVLNKDFDDKAGDLLIEYFERRLLSAINSSWRGDSSLEANFVSHASESAVEVTGAVGLSFLANDKPIEIWFGLGPSAVSILDTSWKQIVRENNQNLITQYGLKESVKLSASLGELKVSPTMLIDYMRSGALIELDILQTNQVLLNVNDNPWASGELRSFEDRYAVTIAQTDQDAIADIEGETRVQLVFDEIQVELEKFLELSQPGSSLVFNKLIGSPIHFVIGGERVAQARLKTLDSSGRFALEVMSK